VIHHRLGLVHDRWRQVLEAEAGDELAEYHRQRFLVRHSGQAYYDAHLSGQRLTFARAAVS